MLGASAPEFERDVAVLLHAFASVVADGQIKLSMDMALSSCRLVPCDSFLHVWRVVPTAAFVTLRGIVLRICVATF